MGIGSGNSMSLKSFLQIKHGKTLKKKFREIKILQKNFFREIIIPPGESCSWPTTKTPSLDISFPSESLSPWSITFPLTYMTQRPSNEDHVTQRKVQIPSLAVISVTTFWPREEVKLDTLTL